MCEPCPNKYRDRRAINILPPTTYSKSVRRRVNLQHIERDDLQALGQCPTAYRHNNEQASPSFFSSVKLTQTGYETRKQRSNPRPIGVDLARTCRHAIGMDEHANPYDRQKTSQAQGRNHIRKLWRSRHPDDENHPDCHANQPRYAADEPSFGDLTEARYEVGCDHPTPPRQT